MAGPACHGLADRPAIRAAGSWDSFVAGNPSPDADTTPVGPQVPAKSRTRDVVPGCCGARGSPGLHPTAVIHPVPIVSVMGNAQQFDVEVRSSTRRRKTAAARIEGGRVVVVVPAHWGPSTTDRVVADLVGRLARRHPAVGASDADLMSRAEQLAEKYFGGLRPFSVRWASNQSARWGSCTTLDGRIRISDRLRGVPSWVLDAVLVHELAHLLEQDHSPRFHELEDRYPRRAEADTFLSGFALGLAWRGAGQADEPGSQAG
jgi:hypothetical protein